MGKRKAMERGMGRADGGVGTNTVTAGGNGDILEWTGKGEGKDKDGFEEDAGNCPGILR